MGSSLFTLLNYVAFSLLDSFLKQQANNCMCVCVCVCVGAGSRCIRDRLEIQMSERQRDTKGKREKRDTKNLIKYSTG